MRIRRAHLISAGFFDKRPLEAIPIIPYSHHTLFLHTLVLYRSLSHFTAFELSKLVEHLDHKGKKFFQTISTSASGPRGRRPGINEKSQSQTTCPRRKVTVNGSADVVRIG